MNEQDNYGFPSFGGGVGTPVVMDSRKNVEFINVNSPFGGLAQQPEQIALSIGIGVAGFVVGAVVQYIICCQASKRCG